jgi:O-antigen ligase
MIAQHARLSRGLAPGVILAATALLAVAAASGQGIKVVAPIVVGVALLAAWHRSLLQWRSLVGLILGVVLVVPIGRYTLPGSLPFNLELYRIVVAMVVVVWLASLLIDPRVRLERTYFDRPLLLLAGCILASELANPGRVNEVGDSVVKTLTFFLSFLLVYYVTATTIRGRASVVFLLKLLVIGGVVIGAFAVVEQRSGFNAFDQVHSVLPFLQHAGAFDAVTRGGNLRVFGPAQHPIALGAALVMILPVAVYFARTSSRRWWVAAVIIVLGALASGSRTAVTMIVAEIAVFLVLKPAETKRLWPALVPAIVVIHAFLPGQIGSFKQAFFPQGGLVAEATQLAPNSNEQLAGGRIRQLKPMIREASGHPLFGEGFGTRITGFNTPQRNAPILDNQWLNNLLDVGYIGFFLWVWLFVRAVRRLVRESRSAGDEGDQWLFAAFAAALVAFPIGMLTFDAFGFTQVFFLFWIMLGLSATLIRESASRPTLAPAA